MNLTIKSLKLVFSSADGNCLRRTATQFVIILFNSTGIQSNWNARCVPYTHSLRRTQKWHLHFSPCPAALLAPGGKRWSHRKTISILNKFKMVNVAYAFGCGSVGGHDGDYPASGDSQTSISIWGDQRMNTG